MKDHSSKASGTPAQKGRFDLFVPFGKACVVTKELDGVQRKYLRGIATNTNPDRENDVVTRSFLAKMRKVAIGLTVFKEHMWDIDFTLGYISELDGDEDTLIVETLLEPEENNPEVVKILNKLEHGTRLGYSIGGFLTKTKKVKGEDGTVRRELEDGELVEVSVTAMPANTDTWVTALTKSMNSLEPDETDVQSKQEEATMPEQLKQATPEMVVKMLDEMMEKEKLGEDLWNLFWSFRQAISAVMYADNLDPAQKRAGIESVSSEFAVKVEEISTRIAELTETVAIELSGQ
jgi:HK97 family phage prohead protease